MTAGKGLSNATYPLQARRSDRSWIERRDFLSFGDTPLTDEAATMNKGMPFPLRVDGRYARSRGSGQWNLSLV